MSHITPWPMSRRAAECTQGLRVTDAETTEMVDWVRLATCSRTSWAWMGVRANFQMAARAIKRGIPLLLEAIDNRRSLVSLDNLVYCIAACVSHPAAAHQTFLVSDGEDLSTTDLVRRMARATRHGDIRPAATSAGFVVRVCAGPWSQPMNEVT